MSILTVAKTIQASDATPLTAEKVLKEYGYKYQMGSVVKDGGRIYEEKTDLVFFVRYSVDGEEVMREITEPVDKETSVELEDRAIKMVEAAHGLGEK